MEKELIEQELVFKAVRSSGPGGQHVNKVSSKVQLSFDVKNSKGLNDREKTLLLEKLGNQISNTGVLLISADNNRSQLKNRTDVVKRFYKLVEVALKVKKKRKPTKPSKAAIAKRLSEKKRASKKKSNREKPDRNS